MKTKFIFNAEFIQDVIDLIKIIPFIHFHEMTVKKGVNSIEASLVLNSVTIHQLQEYMDDIPEGDLMWRTVREENKVNYNLN